MKYKVSVARTEPKVNVPKLVTHLNWAPLYEWCVVRCGATNRHHNAMSLQEIGLSAQILLTILGSIVRIIEQGEKGQVLLGHFMEPTFLTLESHSSNMGAQKSSIDCC